MAKINAETVLRRALTANAGFSALSGALCLALSEEVANFTGIPLWEVKSVGINLALFAAGIFWLVTRDLTQTWARTVVACIIGLDVLWVLGSAFVLMAPMSLTTGGKWAVGIVALCVADFAFFQWRGWRGLHRENAPVVTPNTI